MKIITRVGERLLPPALRAELRPVLAVTGAGTALLTGSAILAVRSWAWLTERLTLGERAAALLAGGYLAVFSCAHAPDVARFAAPAVVVAWCAAAWCVAPPAEPQPQPQPQPEPEAESEAPPAASPEDVYTAALEWIRGQIGTSNGVHLSQLLAHAQAHGMHTDLGLTAFRTALEQRGFPIRQQLKVGRRNRPGIHRDDLPAQPLSGPSPEESLEATTATEYPA